MTSLSDTLTVCLVLVLLFGSIALYLYTRIQQAEQKISLLEGILLDLKMSTEVKSYTELPAHEESVTKGGSNLTEAYMPYGEDDDEENDNDSPDNYYPGAVINASGTSKSPSPSPSVSSRNADADDNEVDQYKSVIADAIKDDSESKVEEVLPNASKVTVNYEAMTLKELQNLAKSRGITGAGSMKKGPIIEALRTSDRSQTTSIEPGSFGTSGSTFLETSSTFLEQDSK
jgi:hypothetical protein